MLPAQASGRRVHALRGRCDSWMLSSRGRWLKPEALGQTASPGGSGVGPGGPERRRAPQGEA